ncbi:conserved hypothetical protein [Marinobacter salarius]|nr:conserved hypothetical protein [Marinobacter salarius]VXB86746.1 conserved hypothetical protein [Marinobacter salarius]
MTEIRHSQRRAGRVVYPTSYCPQSFQAMKVIQERMKNACDITFSLSVIARALGLMTAQGVPTADPDELVAFCKECASKSKKRGQRRGDHA